MYADYSGHCAEAAIYMGLKTAKAVYYIYVIVERIFSDKKEETVSGSSSSSPGNSSTEANSSQDKPSDKKRDNSKAVNIAKGELGNTNKYKKYGNTSQWCVAFVIWAYDQAGALDVLPDQETLSTSTMKNAYINSGRYVAWDPNVDLSPGDLIFFDSHTAMVAEFDGETITTIEGNFSYNNGPYCVYSRELSITKLKSGGNRIRGFGINS